MCSSNKQLSVLIFSVLVIVTSAGDFSDCANSENPIACKSVNFLSKAFNQVLSNTHDETIKILPGLEIVQNENINTIGTINDERSMSEQEPMLLRIAKYLQTHDLKIKFSDILGKTDLQEIVNNVFSSDDPLVNEARKKDKGGGYLLMSALMMGKMMAAMGLGGVGALALKALGVSMMALMLAGAAALKKLTEGGGGDGGHQVHYVSAGHDHHRKRRSIAGGKKTSKGYGYGYVAPLPYRSYEKNS